MRKDIRLKGYDYSNAGYYFLTFCVKNKHELLGEVVGDAAPGVPYVQLSEYGSIVNREIEQSKLYYENLIVEKVVVMPNHVHLLIVICESDGTPRMSFYNVQHG